MTYQTEDESACMISSASTESNILPAPIKYIQSAGGQMTTHTEVSLRTLNEAMELEREGEHRCRRPDTGNAVSHMFTQNKPSR